MSNYFVVFHAENEDDTLMNDVIEYPKEISNIQDIKNIERRIEHKWFDDGRKIVLLNYKKM